MANARDVGTKFGWSYYLKIIGESTVLGAVSALSFIYLLTPKNTSSSTESNDTNFRFTVAGLGTFTTSMHKDSIPQDALINIALAGAVTGFVISLLQALKTKIIDLQARVETRKLIEAEQERIQNRVIGLRENLAFAIEQAMIERDNIIAANDRIMQNMDNRIAAEEKSQPTFPRNRFFAKPKTIAEQLKALNIEKIPEDYCCPLGGEVMEEPVLLRGDERTYERKEIERWLRTNKISPFTQRRITEIECELIPNQSMRSNIQNFLSEQIRLSLSTKELSNNSKEKAITFHAPRIGRSQSFS